MELDEKALLTLVIKNQMDNQRELLETKSEFKLLKNQLVNTEQKLDDLMTSVIKMTANVETVFDKLCEALETNSTGSTLSYI